MPAKTAYELAERFAARLFAPKDLVVEGAKADSRLVGPGDLFVAIRGRHQDGHDFVADAFRRGAVLALVERPVPEPHLLVPDVRGALLRFVASWRQEFGGVVVAVTGSVGKTTTKELLRQALGGPERVFATPGNYNTDIGLPLSLLDGNPGQAFAVCEIGMRGPGEIHRLATLVRPHLGIITNISAAHVGLLGSLEHIAHAKAELLGALDAEGTAILPKDDAFFPLLRLFAPRRVTTVAERGEADYVPEDVQDESVDGWRFTFLGEEVRLPWPGRGALRSALFALASAAVLGVPLREAAARLGSIDRPPPRLSVHKGEVEVLDDSYNASPASVMAALELLSGRPGRKVAVLGSMKELGADTETYHWRIGEQVARLADILVAVGEEAAGYVEGARAKGMPEERMAHAPDVASAAPLLKALVRPGDVVLLKGSRSVGLERLLPVLLGEEEGGGR